ncbi:MAG: hypothetical protein ACSLE7_16920, partial [Mycobacterium sp.]
MRVVDGHMAYPHVAGANSYVVRRWFSGLIRLDHSRAIGQLRPATSSTPPIATGCTSRSRAATSPLTIGLQHAADRDPSDRERANAELEERCGVFSDQTVPKQNWLDCCRRNRPVNSSEGKLLRKP